MRPCLQQHHRVKNLQPYPSHRFHFEASTNTQSRPRSPSPSYSSSLSALCACVSALFPILSSLTCFLWCLLATACALSQNSRAARPSSVSRTYRASMEKETSRPPVSRSGRESGFAQAITASSWRLGVYFERSLSLSERC